MTDTQERVTMSHNFDILAARVRRRDYDNTGSFNTKDWNQLSASVRDMWRSFTKSTLECLVEDGFDFAGVEQECEFEWAG